MAPRKAKEKSYALPELWLCRHLLSEWERMVVRLHSYRLLNTYCVQRDPLGPPSSPKLSAERRFERNTATSVGRLVNYQLKVVHGLLGGAPFLQMIS